jgi:hypothetical protein
LKKLLKQAEAAKFDVLLTVDRGFEYQQKLADRQIAVIVFCGKSVLFEDLLPLMTNCLDHLKTIRPGNANRRLGRLFDKSSSRDLRPMCWRHSRC